MGALYHALNMLNKSPSTHRVLPSSLTLGAILIYMLNALNYRPAEGQRETELTQTCCWNAYKDSVIVVDSDDQDADPVPVMLVYGLYFISGVTRQDDATLRMGGANTVSSECIERLYNVRRDRDLNVAFRIKASNSQRANPRTENRRKDPVDVRLVAEQGELVAQDTPLADLGITLKPLPRAHGADIRAFFRNQVDDGEGRQEERIDDVVARIWRQFPYDLFENAPNHRHIDQGSYLLLSVQQRQESTFKVFQTTDLRKLFSRVVVKIVSPDKWQETEFRRYFPDKGFVAPKRLQNFPRMLYFQEWNTLMQNLTSEEAKLIRLTFWERFKTFKWLPLTESDRLWTTKLVKMTPHAEWIHLPQNDQKPVVRIGLNGELVKNVDRIRLFKKPEIVVEVDSDEGLGSDGAGGPGAQMEVDLA
jgi:hypothetical protein